MLMSFILEIFGFCLYMQYNLISMKKRALSVLELITYTFIVITLYTSLIIHYIEYCLNSL